MDFSAVVDSRLDTGDVRAGRDTRRGSRCGCSAVRCRDGRLAKACALYPVVRGSGVRFGTVRTLGGETVEDGVRRAEVERHGNIRFFRPSVPVGSFSFFHRIWIEEPAGDRGRLSEIIAHERGHVSSGHSWDRLWAAALCAVLWWSPFVWMWSRSLKEVHEYQADRTALDRGFDSRQYIILMLRQSTDLHPELVSGFGHSLIKKRLVMISRFSPRRAKFRILLSLPLVALLMGARIVYRSPDCRCGSFLRVRPCGRRTRVRTLRIGSTSDPR